MQHYGLPTRLLDWTWSPLIAAYFACDGHHAHQVTGNELTESASCIWAVAPGPLNELAGLDPYLYPLDAKTLQPMLRAAIKGRDEHDVIAAAMAVESDLRMLVQQGAFTVHTGERRILDYPQAPHVLRKLVVPAEVVPRMAVELRMAGFRLGNVFPDLASLALELRAT